MGDDQEACNTGLHLGLGMGELEPMKRRQNKKLRLTNEQSSLLETSFEFRNTLNPAQKQALSKQLGLKPRQIEVWFQNRRARTKLKQMETDCELLKQWGSRLLNENRRLKIELQNLRSATVESPPSIFMNRVSKREDALTTCPYCGDDPNAAVLSVGSGNVGHFDFIM